LLSDAPCNARQNDFEGHLGNTEQCTCCGELPVPLGLISTLRASVQAELTGVSKCRTAWHRPNRGYRCPMPTATAKNACKETIAKQFYCAVFRSGKAYFIETRAVTTATDLVMSRGDTVALRWPVDPCRVSQQPFW
jgi:hypothetical protein